MGRPGRDGAVDVRLGDSKRPRPSSGEEKRHGFEEAGRSQGLQACGQHGEGTEVSRSVSSVWAAHWTQVETWVSCQVAWSGA